MMGRHVILPPLSLATGLALCCLALAAPQGCVRPASQGAVRPAPPNCPACAMGLTAERIFERLDTDRNRSISVAEFAQSPGIHDEKEAREAAGRIDTDRDGTLSWPEFAAAHKQRHARCPKPQTAPGPQGRGNRTRFAQVFIMRNDRNGDGKVDKSEFRGSAQRFDQMDTNKNGQLDPEELAELHARRMADPKSMRERLRDGDAPRPPLRTQD